MKKKSKQRRDEKHTSADNIIYDFNPEGRTIHWYGDIDRCLGFDKGAFQNAPSEWARIIHSDDFTLVMHNYFHCSVTGEDSLFHYRIIRPDGSIRHLEEHVVPVMSGKNRVIRWLGTIRDYTYRKEIAATLKESEKKYHALFENATDAIYLIDRDSKEILDCNIKAAELTGYSKSEITSMRIEELHPVDEQDIVSKIFNRLLTDGQLSGISGLNQLSRDGTLIPVEINASTITINGQHFFLCIFRDVTERKKAEEYLRHEKDKLISILDSMEDGVYIVNEHYDIEYINPVLKKIFGAIKGEKCYKYFHNKKTICPWCKNREVLSGKTVHWEWKAQKNRRTYDLIDTPLHNPDGTVSKMVTLRDITERKRIEKELAKASITDNLTGLLNRRGFFTLAGQQRREADRNKRRMSLFYFDMDDLKGINETFGYKAGDQALVLTANILKKSFRKSDVISRISGDEFAVLIPESHEHDIEHIVHNNIVRNLEEHNKKKATSFRLSLCTGIAHYDPAKPSSIDDLLVQADAFMHKTKMYRLDKKEVSASRAETEEERGYKRYATDEHYIADLAVLDNASIKNISRGGMCLVTSQYLNTRNTYRISIHSGESAQITLTGKVVWSSLIEAREDSAEGTPRYEAGLSFIKMNEKKTQFLTEFITSLEQ